MSALRSAVRGRVLLPGDPEFAAARRPWNLAVDQSVAAVVEALLADPIAPLLSVQVRHLGGALARPSDSPHGALTEPYLVYLFGIPTDPAAVGSKQRALAEALPVSGRKPLTFLNPHETVADAFDSATLARLREVKRRHDPRNVFRGNFPL